MCFKNLVRVRVFRRKLDGISKISYSITHNFFWVFSILAGSAGPEREFSRMGYLLTPRRSSYKSSNTNKRLTLANRIPQKRRLEIELNARNVKRRKLFDSNQVTLILYIEMTCKSYY